MFFAEHKPRLIAVKPLKKKQKKTEKFKSDKVYAKHSVALKIDMIMWWKSLHGLCKTSGSF